MSVDEELAGETYGIPLERSSPGLTDLPESERHAAIHCYSNSILPSFQHQGLGTILKAHWLGIAAAKGYKTFTAMPGPEQAKGSMPAWVRCFYGVFPIGASTGEEYKLYRLPLR
jgi:GNAT superfamily N-acetyltransferase